MSGDSDNQRAEKVYRGGCYCGATRWETTGKPMASAYCHCTLCQRLTSCPFTHTMHYPTSAFKWTHEEPVYGSLDVYAVASKPWKKRWRCKVCGACVASFNEKKNACSVWGSQLERDTNGVIKEWDDLKPTVHIFYDTRLVDINDGLSKWAGYEGNSERLG